MKKPGQLRQALTAAVPRLAGHPDTLHMFVDKGRVIATGGPALSFEYAYTLNIVITDYPDDAATVTLPILIWLRTHQPDMLLSRERRREGFTFEVDILNHDTVDLSIDLQLTEAVRVRTVDGRLVVEHVDEPGLDAIGAT
ncbi:phage tail protein [Pandoraea sp.]|uniref:phage tail protein n=1 Tax=Pandoraea sp. TaxID=1883445 RepID=UPI00122A1598|nr:phage tail protein [Pandoraea sp.]TAL53827.1 MAG: phage tail protein [Pandoraea sp.]TAM17080.1 MAG: phage tail protein [Pandoraea sp.]